MDRQKHKDDLIKFLRTIQRPDYPLETIDDDMSLTEAGLIDSLAILQIITYLEENCDLDFRETGIDPGELRSVNAILDLLERDRPR